MLKPSGPLTGTWHAQTSRTNLGGQEVGHYGLQVSWNKIWPDRNIKNQMVESVAVKEESNTFTSADVLMGLRLFWVWSRLLEGRFCHNCVRSLSGWEKFTPDSILWKDPRTEMPKPEAMFWCFNVILELKSFECETKSVVCLDSQRLQWIWVWRVFTSPGGTLQDCMIWMNSRVVAYDAGKCEFTAACYVGPSLCLTSLHLNHSSMTPLHLFFT